MRVDPSLLWVLLATVIAGALRLHCLGEWSFWIDEAHTFRDATMPLEGESSFWNQDRAFYPLTFLGLRFLIDAGWIGAGEGWLRLPFALFGVVTVPLMWICGRRLVGDGAAVFSAFLLALMPWHVFWSQNARGYVFVVLAAVVATGSLWRWVEAGRVGQLFRALLVIGIGALFHPTIALLGFGLLAFLALRRLQAVSLRTVLFAFLGAIMLLAVLPKLIAVFSPIQGFLMAKADTSVLHLALTTGYYFRPVLIVAAVIGYVLLRRSQGRDRALLLACLGVIPIAVLAVLGGTLAKTTARYAIGSLPAVLWLGAIAARELAVLVRPGPGAASRLIAGFVGFALLFDFGSDCWRYFDQRHGDRARWRDACDWVKAEYQGGRVYALTVNEPSVAYYLTPEVWRNAGAVEGPYTVWLVAHWDNEGLDQDDKRVHPAGWSEHLKWRRQQAANLKSELVVLVTRPELDEVDQGDASDPSGELWRVLRRDFELVRYLPCWVGPKDESIWVFVPRRS